MTMMADITKTLKAHGPMDVADYMALCAKAYYQRPHTIGHGGDFVTSPELISLYGEILALWFVAQFDKMWPPQPITFIELGPGRGTLLRDMLGIFKRYPEWYAYIEVRLLENSHTLQTQQKKVLDDMGVQALWYSTWEDLHASLPPQPTFCVSNEFFDALPIQQYVCAEGHTYRRKIDSVEGALSFVRGPQCAAPPFAVKGEGVYEWNFGAVSIMKDIGPCVSTHGGAFLMVDYGYGSGHGETLQAIHEGAYADPLAYPGASDITAHVDFGALTKCFDRGDTDVFLTTQGDFLTALGVCAYAAKQWSSLDVSQQKNMQDALGRLLSQSIPTHMGALFKVLGGTKVVK